MCCCCTRRIHIDERPLKAILNGNVRGGTRVHGYWDGIRANTILGIKTLKRWVRSAVPSDRAANQCSHFLTVHSSGFQPCLRNSLLCCYQSQLGGATHALGLFTIEIVVLLVFPNHPPDIGSEPGKNAAFQGTHTGTSICQCIPKPGHIATQWTGNA